MSDNNMFNISKSLMSAISDVMKDNQDLYKQDLERQVGYIANMTPDQVEAQVKQNEVDVPDPVPEAENIDPETIIPGSSGISDE